MWVLTEISKYVMEAFSRNIGNVSQLNITLVRQFNADIGKFLIKLKFFKFLVFLMEALLDLRLQPTPRLKELAKKIKTILPS